MKKQKKIEHAQKATAPRFKQGAGTESWKLATALILALALGIGGAIAMSNTKSKPALTDYELGIEVVAPPNQGAAG